MRQIDWLEISTRFDSPALAFVLAHRLEGKALQYCLSTGSDGWADEIFHSIGCYGASSLQATIARLYVLDEHKNPDVFSDFAAFCGMTRSALSDLIHDGIEPKKEEVSA